MESERRTGEALRRCSCVFYVGQQLSVLQDAVTVLPPCARSGVQRTDPLCFLSGCRKSRLNQALSVPSLGLDFYFLSVSIVLLTRATFLRCFLCYFCLFCLWLFLLGNLGCQYQYK